MSYPRVLCLCRPCLIPIMPSDSKRPFSFDAPAIPCRLALLMKQHNWHMMHAAIQSRRQGKLYITSLFTWKTNINGTVPLLGLWGQITCQRKRPLTIQQYTNMCQHHQATDKSGTPRWTVGTMARVPGTSWPLTLICQMGRRLSLMSLNSIGQHSM